MSSPTISADITQLNLYGYPLIIVLGNIGNILIIIIFSRQRLNACSTYVFSLAIVNNIYLTFNCLSRIFPYTFTDMTISAFVYCKMRYYISGTFGQVAKTIIVLAAVDRYMITNNRASFRAFSTPKGAKYLIFFSFIFWLIAGVHIPIMVTINNGICSVFGIYATIFSVYAILGIGLLPPIISTVFSYLTYRNIRERTLRVYPIGQNTNNGNVHIRRQDRDLLILVISEVILYIVLTSLYPSILAEMMISRYIIPNKSIQYTQIEGLISTIAFLLAYANHGASFYVYIISSKSFRRDFKALFTKYYRKLTGQISILPTSRANKTLTQVDTRN